MSDPKFIARIASEMSLAPPALPSNQTCGPEVVAAAVKETLGDRFAGLTTCGMHPMRYLPSGATVIEMNAEFGVLAPTRLRAVSLAFKVSDRIQALIGPTTIWELTVRPDGGQPRGV